MELHSGRRLLPGPIGEERNQMLSLNQRLESYLGKVRLLEEENGVLRGEIQALRRSQGQREGWREGLEEDLRRVRMEVQEAWSKRALVELEAGNLARELQVLGLQREREAEAREEVKRRLVESEREMEEERRAQTWLRERMCQLENEVEVQVQNHRHDVACLQATLIHSRPTLPPLLPPGRPNTQTDLFTLGEEFSQRASSVWQDASKAYQSQVVRLEESLAQARSRLAQVGQERSESLLKLHALEQELVVAQDKRQFLEENLVQQRHRQNQEMKQLQAHVEVLEVEKEDLGQQIDCLLVNSRSLLQLKMTLGLEVATYRALLDGERLDDENRPRRAYTTDLARRPRGFKQHFKTHVSSSCSGRALLSSLGESKTLSSISGASPRAKPKISSPKARTQKHGVHNETPTSSPKTDPEPVDVTRPVPWSTPYPKVLQGSVDHFRPQDVREEVTYAEPLSPPNEQEGEVDGGPQIGRDRSEFKTWGRKDLENRSVLSAGSAETEPVVESFSFQNNTSLFGHPLFVKAAEEHASPTVIPAKSERPSCFPGDEANEGSSEMAADNAANCPDLALSSTHTWGDQDVREGGERGTWMEGEGKQEGWMERGSSESEDEALIEPTLETSTSSPASVSQHEESMFDPPELLEEEVPHDEASAAGLAESNNESNRSVCLADFNDEGNGSWRNEKLLEDRIYPDGADMDAWDQVIERKVGEDDGESQHVETEEDTSALELEQRERRKKNEVNSVLPCDSSHMPRDASHMTFELIDMERETRLQQKPATRGEEESTNAADEEEANEDEADESPNASWRTEQESDSYAQDNTLADTRPLIRYKSEEADTNTQASHLDESLESSDGEEPKIGPGAWGGSKSKRFGTMEDLCEEAVGDEEYHIESTETQDPMSRQDMKDGMLHSEWNTDLNILKGEEEHLDEETENMIEYGEPYCSAKDYNEINFDRMVEQELENLDISSYSAQFHQSPKSEAATGPGRTRLKFARGNMSSKEQEIETEDDPEKSKEDEPTMATQSQINHTEGGPSILFDLGKPGSRTSNSDGSGAEDEDGDESSNESQCSQPMTRRGFAGQDELVDEIPCVSEIPISGQGHPVERYSRHADHERRLTEEWEVLEARRDQDQRSFKPDFGALRESGDIRVVQVDRVPQESNIFQLENADDLPTAKTKGFISSGKELWGSGMGATCQPDESCDDNTAEEANQNLAFGDNMAWGMLGNLQAANGNREIETVTAKATVYTGEKEPRLTQAKKPLSGEAAGEGEARSEDSEDEGNSWSSGED